MQLIAHYNIVGEMDTALEPLEQLNNTRIVDGLCNYTELTNRTYRIENGLCLSQQETQETQENKSERITAKARRHYGDDGSSLLMNGTRISKAHVACNFYQSIEELQQAIAECLYYVNLYDEKTSETFKWLFNSLFSTSSFVFCKADSTRHQLPQRFLEFIEEDCAALQKEIGGAKDFVCFSHRDLLHLNKVRIAVRKAESTYVAWKESSEMTNFLLNNPHLIQSVNFHITILNRLSSWVFWVARKQGLSLQSKGTPLQEIFWSAEVEPFNF